DWKGGGRAESPGEGQLPAFVRPLVRPCGSQEAVAVGVLKTSPTARFEASSRRHGTEGQFRPGTHGPRAGGVAPLRGLTSPPATGTCPPQTQPHHSFFRSFHFFRNPAILSAAAWSSGERFSFASVGAGFRAASSSRFFSSFVLKR